MDYDVIVVGGGIAGLTSAAYVSKAGYKVLVCEKENKVGGLVNSFNYKGFTFDGGIRAIENSGIVMPMLRQLGLDIEFVKNNVSIGIEHEIIKVQSRENINDYKKLLSDKFPDNINDIEKIIDEIKKIINYMDIIYAIENPLFLDLKNSKEYLNKDMLVWFLKFLVTINKTTRLGTSVDEYLRTFTKNEALIDMICQHFFKKTPTFFALSYFGLYLDYKYPKGGTGAFIEKIEKFILDNNGQLKKGTEICHVDLQLKKIKDSKGNEYKYDKLIWASDLKKLYNNVDLESISNKSVKKKVMEKKASMLDKKGGDSIFTVYITVDLDKSYFDKICTDHFFYTPIKTGLSTLNNEKISKALEHDEICTGAFSKEEIINWIKEFYKLTTYEISIPVMKDSTLAPPGKTGLIISTLMDYSIVKYISEMGWYDEFKGISEGFIINILEESIFPGMKNRVMDRFSSTPLTIEKITGNSQGAITGWAFTNSEIPVKSKMSHVAKSVGTPIPDVYQCGQWSFSPSGLPISVFTGKLAADKVIK